jgi:hypothetical protein
MRTLIAGATLVAVTIFAPVAVATEPSLCQPNPLTHSHPASVQVPATAVDLGGPAPVSATNPLMLGNDQLLPAAAPASGRDFAPVDPLTHQP